MNKIRLFFIVFLLTGNTLFAQHIFIADKKELQQKEDSLKTFAIQIIQGRNAGDRLNADSQFTKNFHLKKITWKKMRNHQWMEK